MIENLMKEEIRIIIEYINKIIIKLDILIANKIEYIEKILETLN